MINVGDWVHSYEDSQSLGYVFKISSSTGQAGVLWFKHQLIGVYSFYDYPLYHMRQNLVKIKYQPTDAQVMRIVDFLLER